MAGQQKPVVFCGASLTDLRAFPQQVRRTAGFQLDRVQNGLEPDDWKPMNAVGPGVREIRVRDAKGAFRVIYVTKLGDAIYVLHCFQKKSAKTSKGDIDIARHRHKQLLKDLNE